jgi:hypothetical protein
MNPKDLDMLRSYEDGQPRIWDAASLMHQVYDLLAEGLIEPVIPDDPNDANTTYHVDVNNGKACRITDKGRQVLAENDNDG